MVDLIGGYGAALADLFTASPCLAAAGGTRRQVMWVGATGLLAGLALALGSGVVLTEDYAIALLGLCVATAIATFVAGRRNAVEERASWLISIVEQARAATFSFGLDGRVTAWNGEAVRLLGLPADRGSAPTSTRSSRRRRPASWTGSATAPRRGVAPTTTPPSGSARTRPRSPCSRARSPSATPTGTWWA